MSDLHILPLDIINVLNVTKELRTVSKYFNNLMNDTFYKKYSFDSECVDFNEELIRKLHNVWAVMFLNKFISLVAIEYKCNLPLDLPFHVIPNTVKYIKFGGDRQADFYINLLPDTVETIHILGEQKEYENWIFPKNIKKIIIESDVNYTSKLKCISNIIEYKYSPPSKFFTGGINMTRIYDGIAGLAFAT